jgi:hypothetical protein
MRRFGSVTTYSLDRRLAAVAFSEQLEKAFKNISHV